MNVRFRTVLETGTSNAGTKAQGSSARLLNATIRGGFPSHNMHVVDAAKLMGAPRVKYVDEIALRLANKGIERSLRKGRSGQTGQNFQAAKILEGYDEDHGDEENGGSGNPGADALGGSGAGGSETVQARVEIVSVARFDGSFRGHSEKSDVQVPQRDRHAQFEGLRLHAGGARLAESLPIHAVSQGRGRGVRDQHSAAEQRGEGRVQVRQYLSAGSAAGEGRLVQTKVIQTG